MSNLVIVALPAADDPVWKVSSETKPHLTLLFLGDANNPKRDQIAQFMAHAVSTGLHRFGLSVDRRGELGSDRADVLFFDDDWDLAEITAFRSNLLKDNNIRAAYDSVEQFPEWQPHLTLGYPEAPAKDDAIDYPINYVQFDRLALWDQDFEGVELILPRYKYPMEVSMSDISGSGRTVVEGILAHYGVKGMKWGVRKERSPTDVSVTTNPSRKKVGKIRTSGGSNHPPHSDAVNAQIAKQKAKKSGHAALSNQELRDLATRMQLEQQVKDLSARQTHDGKKFVKDTLVTIGKQQATKLANQKANDAFAKASQKNQKK